ncbi:MAG TPA: isochorismatase family protein [Flexivirga sp.]|uniref:isochorismatase family protein n=1 Tax=Flexivirga sp. TaxID=1962927 RepID=UPI002BE1297C|nr:isochorismatase family protein [Flexivirga sp.]HWC24225.1 isochorismatase family protein [Flexivirga sp.]
MADNPVVTALIVVDMQVAFVNGESASPQMPMVLPAVEQQLRSARAAGALVVFLQNDGDVGAGDEPETPGWELALEAGTSETVLRKHEDSGFNGTDLDDVLRQHGVGAVSICGVMSEMCVAATARAAMERGFQVVVAHDSHGTYPVPAYSEHQEGVTAEQAARAAEWSLGDGIIIPASAADVRFKEADRCQLKRSSPSAGPSCLSTAPSERHPGQHG